MLLKREDRRHGDVSKNNCDGAEDPPQVFCYALPTDVDRREADVQRCFDKLYDLYKWNREVSHLSVNEERCRCTVKSISKQKSEETFQKARANLYKQCCAFTYNVVGRYVDDMRLLAMCN